MYDCSVLENTIINRKVSQVAQSQVKMLNFFELNDKNIDF